VIVGGCPVEIPKRIPLLGFREEELEYGGSFRSLIHCLCTRSTDGFARQAALRRILTLNEPWSIPFVVLLAGEYVVEIIDDMVGSILLLDRAAYITFVRENRGTMRILRAKATSYWDGYCRMSHPDRFNYPGLVFLHQVEAWAS
jgi:hypothetical protein